MNTRQPASLKGVARILIVDDHPVVREGLALRIAQRPELEVCGEASDIAEALQQVTVLKPDLAIIDIALKSGNGIDLIKRIKAHTDSVRMLVWSMYNEAMYAERALRAGAMGYITKEQATEKILEAIGRVLEGKIFLSAGLADKLLNRVVGNTGEIGEFSAVSTLSDRELEVFQLLGEGLDTQDVADRMRVSPKTVGTYRARIKEKLGIGSGTELMRCAVQWAVEHR
jgi:DNA-binding NarL/FixJ family response regulator